jgi:hypothetical protein
VRLMRRSGVLREMARGNKPGRPRGRGVEPRRAILEYPAGFEFGDAAMHELLRIVGPALAAVLALQAAVVARPCWKMTKELSELRLEYHLYATGQEQDTGQTRDVGRTQDTRDAQDVGQASEVTFDRLAEMLDKIIDLKREMRKAGCKIRPRKKDLAREIKKRAKQGTKLHR